jgi:hypothetical protein
MRNPLVVQPRSVSVPETPSLGVGRLVGYRWWRACARGRYWAARFRPSMSSSLWVPRIPFRLQIGHFGLADQSLAPSHRTRGVQKLCQPVRFGGFAAGSNKRTLRASVTTASATTAKTSIAPSRRHPSANVARCVLRLSIRSTSSSCDIAEGIGADASPVRTGNVRRRHRALGDVD